MYLITISYGNKINDNRYEYIDLKTYNDLLEHIIKSFRLMTLPEYYVIYSYKYRWSKGKIVSRHKKYNNPYKIVIIDRFGVKKTVKVKNLSKRSFPFCWC